MYVCEALRISFETNRMRGYILFIRSHQAGTKNELTLSWRSFITMFNIWAESCWYSANLTAFPTNQLVQALPAVTSYSIFPGVFRLNSSNMQSSARLEITREIFGCRMYVKEPFAIQRRNFAHIVSYDSRIFWWYSNSPLKEFVEGDLQPEK